MASRCELSGCEENSETERNEDKCKKSRRCNKSNKHGGKCDTKRPVNSFWLASPAQEINTFKRGLLEETDAAQREYREKVARMEDLEEKEQMLSSKTHEVEQLKQEAETLMNTTRREAAESQEKVDQLNREYERLKILLRPVLQAQPRRIKNSTTYEMITDPNNSNRYRRRKETADILNYIHGGEEAAIYGAWDLIASSASKEVFDKLISTYKRGKYLQGVFGKAISDYSNSENALQQAVAMKYQNFLSRRKFNLICKTQSSVFNAEKNVWVPRNMKCMDFEVSLPKIVSDLKVDKFVKSLDIGAVSQLPNCSGVSRTITGLVYMVLNLYLGTPRLYDQLIWYKENVDHFVFQFSDDGAPETSELGMSIGSLTCWNFGSKVRSRDSHYLLHCVSVSEKDPVMEDLWQQHTDEMEILEGNIINIHGHQCTVEFQPSADQSWQSWASNELNQAATYPSPYANVHKADLNKIGKSIGLTPGDTWQPPTPKKRAEAIKKLQAFRKALPKGLSPAQVHSRELDFMAQNGLRQVGAPRIGIFADRFRPEPVHNEINAWQHILNLLYKEALRRDVIESFLTSLSSPAHHLVTPPDTEAPRAVGCGLSFVAKAVQEHYENKEQRSNNLSIRLIGRQAIALARYGYRLVDCLETECESDSEKILRMVLGKAVQNLRDACTLFNKIDTNLAEIHQLRNSLTQYFNLLALFFPTYINVTVWTIAYALPYHALLLYEQYKVGFGIISLQAKESKHAGIKHDLSLTNRSKATGSLGKWWQVMRANYVRAFYLPEHYPMPSCYLSHYESRLPSHIKNAHFCQCGRDKDGSPTCAFCEESKSVVGCAINGNISLDILDVLHPVCCSHCEERFPDKISCDKHVMLRHVQQFDSLNPATFDPRSLKVNQLRDELRKRNLSTTGNRDHLIKRLECFLATYNG